MYLYSVIFILVFIVCGGTKNASTKHDNGPFLHFSISGSFSFLQGSNGTMKSDKITLSLFGGHAKQLLSCCISVAVCCSIKSHTEE